MTKNFFSVFFSDSRKWIIQCVLFSASSTHDLFIIFSCVQDGTCVKNRTFCVEPSLIFTKILSPIKFDDNFCNLRDIQYNLQVTFPSHHERTKVNEVKPKTRVEPGYFFWASRTFLSSYQCTEHCKMLMHFDILACWINSLRLMRPIVSWSFSF